MQDSFAIFNLPRGPALDAEALKNEFHRRSSAQHPDAGGDAERFAQLNTAYQTLRHAVTRLRHLLELEAPAQLSKNTKIPPPLAEHFLRSAALRQSAESVLAKHRAASSPLARALLAGDLATQEKLLHAVLNDLDAASRNAVARLDSLAFTWRERLEELAGLYAELSYLNKWKEQLRETRLQFDLQK